MSRFETALASLREGGALLLVDEDREGSAHLVAASSTATPEAVLRLVDQGRGPLSIVAPNPAGRRSDERSAAQTSRVHTAAISAALAQLGDRQEGPEATAVSVHRGGVLAHPGAAEGAADLLGAADIDAPAFLRAAALPGGLLASPGAARRVADRHGFVLVSLQDIIAHRLRTETIVEEAAVARLPSRYAEQPFEVHAFRSLIDGSEHLALVRRPGNDAAFGPEPLVRLHSECLTGDALGSLRCDCGEQLRSALQQIAADPQGGAVIYLRGQEGRGIGLANKIRAYALQEQGFDTVEANIELGFPADLRDYGVAIQILNALGVDRLRLLSNNPRKQAALERYGIVVAARPGLRIGPNPDNADYLETKRVKMGHDLVAGRWVVSQ